MKKNTAFWWCGVFIALIPLAVSVASSPSKIFSVFYLSAYLHLGKELLFLLLALLAICIIDLIEALTRVSRHAHGNLVFFVGVVLFQIIIAAMWYYNLPDPCELLVTDGSAESLSQHSGRSDSVALLALVGVAFVESYIARTQW